MPIPSSVSDLSTTASSNYPSGSESANQLDDYHRSLCAIVRQVSDAKEDAGTAASAITAERTAVATLTNKTLVAPALGTPASGNLANCTFPNLTVNTTGTAANLSGTPALPNGTAATTQTAGDNSTKLATTAYVDSKVSLTLMSSVPTTSGTSVQITGIPATAKRVTLLIGDVSTTGTSPLLVQIGSGSFSTSGYESVGSQSSNAGQYLTSTAGFVLEPTSGLAGSQRRHGRITVDLAGSNYYVESGAVANFSYQVSAVSGGRITLGGALDRIRITTVGGSDTFNGGVINVMYE